MLRRNIAAFLAAACCLAYTADAKALLVTSDGTVALGTGLPVSPGPLNNIQTLTGSPGAVYTNQTSGAPFSVGSEIRSIGFYQVSGTTPSSGVPVFPPDMTVVVVTAVIGQITSAAPNAEATFTQGRSFVIAVPNSPPVDVQNPSSWAGYIFTGQLLAEFALKPQEQVDNGSPIGAGFSASAAETNVSGANLLNPSLNQGIFLFREDSGSGANPGDGFLSNVNTSVLPAGYTVDSESLVAVTNQTLLGNMIGDGSAFGAFNQADLDMLNFLAGAAGFGDLGGANTGFATGYQDGSDVQNFIPFWVNPNNLSAGGNGDFFADLSATNYVAIQGTPPEVPEPASMVLFGIGASVCGLGYRRRRQATN